MERESLSAMSSRLAEIERLMEAFREDYALRTSDADNFITIHEIEQMWGELEQNTLNIYSGMVREVMGSVDEKDLIRKKKRVRGKRSKAPHIYENSGVDHHNAWAEGLLQVPSKAARPRKQGHADGACWAEKRCPA